MKLPETLSFTGTAKKSDWWTTTICSTIIETLAFVGLIMAIHKISAPLTYFAFTASAVIMILALWATLAVASRRFRDLGYSPWFTFLYFIPYFGWLLVWLPCGFLPFRFPKRTKVLRRTVSKSSSTP